MRFYYWWFKQHLVHNRLTSYTILLHMQCAKNTFTLFTLHNATRSYIWWFLLSSWFRIWICITRLTKFQPKHSFTKHSWSYFKLFWFTMLCWWQTGRKFSHWKADRQHRNFFWNSGWMCPWVTTLSNSSSSHKFHITLPRKTNKV